jgi:CHAD domain-containing protein
MTTFREREDTYDVPPDLSITNGLMPLIGNGGHVVQREHDLENVYFDTPRGDLQRHGITLRRRRGGSDTGWQLKVPSGQARTEIRVGDSDALPDRLTKLVAGVSRGRELHEVARIRTHRLTHRLLDEREEMVVEVDDDTVHATTPDAVREWREVEVELGEHEDERLLDTIGQHLCDAGATPSPYPSKLARALPRELPADGTSPLTDYLRAQYGRLIAQDVALRRGRGDVHNARVAIRRLRSTLRTFRQVFQPDSTPSLDDELRWFAALLGEVRDREVLQEHLDSAVGALAPELTLGPVKARIDEQLVGEAARAVEDVGSAMSSERYFALLDNVERFVREPPLDAEPLPKQLRKQAKRPARLTIRRLDRGLRPGEGAASDVALHQTRKAAKRARYAAELVRPVVGKPARREAKRFKELQDILGEHQDSVVTARVLHALGARAGTTPGENGFTYGLLFCREQQRAARTRRQAWRWRVS